jgi:hypothetical protein
MVTFIDLVIELRNRAANKEYIINARCSLCPKSTKQRYNFASVSPVRLIHSAQNEVKFGEGVVRQRRYLGW